MHVIRCASIATRHARLKTILIAAGFIGGFVAGGATSSYAAPPADHEQGEVGRGVDDGAMQPYQEYDKKIRASQQVSPLKSDLFGDSINLYDQSTSFIHSDIDLPGSNALPVRLSRRLSVRPISVRGHPPERYGGAGDWDVEVPSISGVFDSMYGWNLNIAGVNFERCSTNLYPKALPPSTIDEIWSGYFLNIPGEGARSLIGGPPNQFKKPDGKVRLWTTRELDSFSCTPMLSGYPGEGFVVETTAGLKYFFNIGTIRGAGLMGRDTTSDPGRLRVEVFLLASRIEDRFGNWVSYSYNANGHPNSITSSDGRSISMTYSAGRLVSATANGRTWGYQYSGSVLSAVTLPDGSSWRFNHLNDMRVLYEIWTEDPGINCGSVAPLAEKTYQIEMFHPAGTKGEFRFDHARHYRSGIPSSYCQPEVVTSGEVESSVVHRLSVSNYFDVLGITSKTISGPGIPVPMIWSYSGVNGWLGLWSGVVAPCMTCPDGKVVVISQPDGTAVVETYGMVFSLNEGKLLRRDNFNPAGSLVRSEELTYMSNAQAALQPFPNDYGAIWGGWDESSILIRPLVKRIIWQDGVEHVWQANSFDAFARPISITQSSNPVP